MFKIPILLLFFLALVCCKANRAQDKITFKIDGEIDDANDSTMALLEFFGVNKPPDTTYIIKGKFTFEGELDEPTFSWLRIENNSVDILLENDTCSLKASIHNLNNSSILCQNTSFLELRQIHAFFDKRMDSIVILTSLLDNLRYSSITNKEKADSAFFVHEISKLQISLENFFSTFIDKNPNSISALSFVLFLYSFSDYININEKYLSEIYSKASFSLKNSLYGKRTKHLIELQMIYTGQTPFFEVAGLNPNGEIVQLSMIENDYVLINFWASWCAPCREENKHLLQCYKLLKEKRNLTILSISLDYNKQDWVKAIKKDSLEWFNICDFRGYTELIPLMYGTRFPLGKNILLNKARKVIAHDFEADTLVNLLSSQ